MSNPFRHLTRNAMPTDISITAYNKLMDMLNWWQTNQARSGGPPLKGLVDWDQCVFKTKNTSGALVPTYGVVGLAGPLYGPTDNLSEFQNVTPMEGVEPVVADHSGGKWGVALEMIDNGCIGRCCFAGVVPTRVYVNGVYDGYCDIIEGETDGDYTCYLGTGQTGAQILWRENAGSGAGTVVWAIVRLGNHEDDIVRCRLTEALYDCQEAQAVVLRTSDPEDPPCDEGETITVTSPIGLVAGSNLASLDEVDEWYIPSGFAVYARRFGDTDKYEALAFGTDPCCEEEDSGSSSSSGSSDSESESESESGSPCRDMIGRYRLSDIPGFAGSVRQYLTHDENGCLEWKTSTEC